MNVADPKSLKALSHMDAIHAPAREAKPKVVLEEEQEESFLRRHWGKCLSVGILAVFGVVVSKSLPGPSAPVRKAPERVMVAIQLPPPPPPPPPPPAPRIQPPKEEKMEEQTPVEKPEDKPEAPKADEAPALGTGIKGNGPADGFGLGGSGGGGGGRFGSGSSRGSKYGAYAYKVQNRISNVMRANSKTRNASFQGEVRIWADAGGQITRAQFIGDASDSSVSNAIKNEVLVGQRLDEPPPPEMKMPIVMRVNAQRPK
ncbi:MAG: hypothetical protein JWL90_392 [Chthoniobacteraceae bacterium]|nr:hypothetical protein [Chthoniobacteraceae bacterium]